MHAPARHMPAPTKPLTHNHTCNFTIIISIKRNLTQKHSAATSVINKKKIPHPITAHEFFLYEVRTHGQFDQNL